MKDTMRKLPWIAAVVALIAIPARAWNSNGHEAVAYIAWKNMTPGQRAGCTEILKGHPHYVDVLAANIQPNDPDRDMHVFMVAATWPDIIRDKHGPEYSEHHPTWHYYDAPITPDGKNIPMPKIEQTTAQPDNAIEALNMEMFILRDKKTPPAKRARALCWVLHIVGDLHQPLHCVSLFDADFPNGDKGGNSIRLKNRDVAFNLHGLWDGILGRNGSFDDVAQASDKFISQSATAVAEKAKDLDPMHWVIEGRDLSVKVVYAGLELDTKGELLTNVDRTNVNPDDNYLRKAKDTAAQQVVLAGERLAAVLK